MTDERNALEGFWEWEKGTDPYGGPNEMGAYIAGYEQGFAIGSGDEGAYQREITRLRAHLRDIGSLATPEDSADDERQFARMREMVMAALSGSPEPLEQRIGPTEPDNDMVICPHCTSQFVAIPVNAQRRMEAPQSLPCECTTYCLHSGYPDAPLRRGYFCREKVNDQKVSERRCVCGVVVIPQGELRVEIGSTTTTHRLAGPCFQTPAQGASRDASSEQERGDCHTYMTWGGTTFYCKFKSGHTGQCVF